MQFTNGNLVAAVNDSLTDVAPGLVGRDAGIPVMTTPATIVTTPEDIALTTAVINATTAAVNYANATNS